MLNRKSNIVLHAFVAMLVIAPATARAGNCGGEPSVSSASSFQAYRSWCSCMKGSVASNLNDAQRQGGCRLPSSSKSPAGSISGGATIGTVIGTAIGKEIGKALFGDPEGDAARKAQAAIDADMHRRAAEEANRKLEEQKARLLGSMMGVDNSTSLGLMSGDSGSELSLMTDNLQAAETQASIGSTEVKRTAIAPPFIVQGLQLMLGDDGEKSSLPARRGFDTEGKILGSDLPAPPPTPHGSPVDKAQMLSDLIFKLEKNDAEEQALKDQLEQLKRAPAPDPVAISQVEEKIVAKEEEKKKIMLDLTADDPDAQGTDQPSGSTAPNAASAAPTATGASH